ncbi:unnamed protein product [Vitrella brassicaformis CCMP3155]|uniref:Transglutaminase-like domain-containing protein n=1 Tax=Vitrella brassicaformis (strain CCMP3155) TaxID=1169540 RepID=A0A0G4GUR0_VITBC|nr:unnamed protein product [Vitrella brassicaformis CCMP3155]|eukprot:CEM34555.1 unnamed protein product [Vitrella brassicaformis CCMP3155]
MLLKPSLPIASDAVFRLLSRPVFGRLGSSLPKRLWERIARRRPGRAEAAISTSLRAAKAAYSNEPPASFPTQLHTMHHEPSNQTFYALGSDQEKFEIFVDDFLGRAGEEVHLLPPSAAAAAAVREVDLVDEGFVDQARGWWKTGRMLIGDSEVMSFLFSRQTFNRSFESFLSTFCGFENELRECTNEDIVRHLTRDYDRKSIERLQQHQHQHRSSSEAIEDEIKRLLAWFRETFPYYHGFCPECTNQDGSPRRGRFIGATFANEAERRRNASITEIYLCDARKDTDTDTSGEESEADELGSSSDGCRRVYRFPRYRASAQILRSKQGRCGEYSRLFHRVLESLGFASRWVIDWDDHVWVEMLLLDKWVHIDPCEAALDAPLLYESWGKSPTYVFAFGRGGVEDVTERYTNATRETLLQRRRVSESTIHALVEDASRRVRAVYGTAGGEQETPVSVDARAEVPVTA